MSDNEDDYEKRKRQEDEKFQSGWLTLIFAAAALAVGYFAPSKHSAPELGIILGTMVPVGLFIASAVKLDGYLCWAGLDERSSEMVAWGYGLAAVFLVGFHFANK
jgi:hypothetical protein